MSPVGTAVLGLALTWAVIRLSKVGSREPGIPPGPPTKPFLGNILDIPKEAMYRTFAAWAKTYGDIYSAIGRGTIIVVSSPQMVRELLDKHSSTTAGRLSSHFAKLVLDGLNIAFLTASDPTFKVVRRGLQNLLSKESCADHVPVQQAEASQLMYDLLKRPEAYFTHVERFSFSIVLSVTFGVRCPRTDSEVLREFSRFEHDWEHLITPGHHPPVDFFPLLQYVPETFAPWKGLCRDLKARNDKFYYGLLEACERRMEREEYNGCFIENILLEKEENGIARKDALAISVAAIEGGSITTASFMRSLICCLAAYPEVLERAHEEIDRVIGQVRIPTLEDIESLPYIQAIMKEVHRFCPAAPMGLPHLSTAEVMVGGYVIPKDSTIFMNIYGMYHDDRIYDRPYEFRPERFLDSEFGTIPGTDDTDRCHDMHFGAGRRICPGITLVTNSTTTATLNLLWGFDVSVKKDPVTGKDLPIDPQLFTDAFIVSCTEVPVDITPRSDSHAHMIRSQYVASREILKNYEHDLSPEDAAFVEYW
ncbi:cytochrome P450 [Cristinia sonorae]|uniref:Cytochrome P450 n=1 Tax=Cristinia sonorae TaxID=1940300 RepID=A0A8K0UDA5_9AGAR|nr:cytochrome P450 [Cristinia sonorae]